MAACSVEELLAKAEQDEAEKLRSVTVHKELDLEFDVGNLLACDKNRIESRDLGGQRRDDFLQSLARDNTQLLVNEIWKQPTERVEEAIVAKLPEPTTPLPREKPPPKRKPPTKWEQFAKLKGIQKKKKTNLVWDENAKEWKRRWGYQRARDDTKDWLVEVPETADPNEDQFAKRVKAKKERVAKNELNRLRNIARAQKIKVPGVGLTPVAQQSKDDLSRAVSVAKHSTASVGMFQDRLPKEKPPKNTGKRRKFGPLIGDFSSERQKQLELLKIMDSKRPKLDITKAVNKQMREEDREEAAASARRERESLEESLAPVCKCQIFKMQRIYMHSHEHFEVFTTVLAPQGRYRYRAGAEKMVVVHSYRPHWPDELELSLGDVILVLSKHEEERWFGRRQHGQQGYFPASCVMELSQQKSLQTGGVGFLELDPDWRLKVWMCQPLLI
ncbi:putative ribosome biogenesis regulatory protein -like [Scophthalmus maximus]|uniref:Ribosome biogenesis regulatory protein n=1 Tax=Scophthalmus maximus TaxID=52904 RepID=A0A2U9D1K0_SCOMX|nr:putative ribosome biogenesis regulatory protein -like [Scophthalmus maximus]